MDGLVGQHRTLVRRILLGASIALYVLSLTQKTFCVGAECDAWPGYGILMWGWFTLMTLVPANLTWLANPLIIASWPVTAGGYRPAAAALSGLGLLVAFLFLFFPDVVATKEGDISTRTALLAGYWLWLASAAAAHAAALLTERRA